MLGGAEPTASKEPAIQAVINRLRGQVERTALARDRLVNLTNRIYGRGENPAGVKTALSAPSAPQRPGLVGCLLDALDENERTIDDLFDQVGQIEDQI